MLTYSYDKVTMDTRLHIDNVTALVRALIAEGKNDDAMLLAYSTWGAFRLWERITRSEQQDGHALKLEQSIEKLIQEASQRPSNN